MAFSTKVGSFTCPASTGNQSVTGLGFQPKAVIFLGSETDTDESKANALMSIGWATSSTARHTVSLVSLDAYATSFARRYQSNAGILASTAAIVRYLADFVSMDADGFTINWSTVQSGEQIIFLALGGDDLTNVAVKNFESRTTTGNQATTGVGFQPDAILFIGGLCDTGTLAAEQSNLHYGMGCAISSSSRAALGAFSAGAAATTDANQNQVGTKCFTILNGSSVFEEADLVSMDSDGFTLNWTTAYSDLRWVSALCLKGGQYKIGVETQKTSTGTKATTGVGFQPSGLFVFGANKAASTAVQANLRLSIGMASSTTARACHWIGDQDAAADSIADSDHDTAAILKHLTEGTPTLDAEADLSSFDSDGFTLNWTTADATAREFVYVAFGSDAGAATGNPWNYYAQN
jgi:hypothetical protein